MRTKDQLNCPNCGAPIVGEKCEYCGTVFYDWACLNMDRPSYIKMKIHDNLVLCKARMESISANYDCDMAHLYADDLPIYTVRSPGILRIEPVFIVEPEDGILYSVKCLD